MPKPSLHGIERNKFLVASTIVVVFTLAVVGATVALINTYQTPHNIHDQVILSGQIACLPHKAGGVHTEECAIGLHSDDNRYYQLNNAPASLGTQTGRRIQIKGTLVTTTNSTYDTAGIITVSAVTLQQ